MIYIRILKQPLIVTVKRRLIVSALITLSSDLGIVYPRSVSLVTKLLLPEGKLIALRNCQWSGDTCTLRIEFDISLSFLEQEIALHIEGAASNHEDHIKIPSLQDFLFNSDARSVVSLRTISTVLDKKTLHPHRILRHFNLGVKQQLVIREITGDNIAGHVWDAGIVLASTLRELLAGRVPQLQYTSKMLKSNSSIIELGAGTGIIGLSLAALKKQAKVILTDVDDARELIEENISINENLLEGRASFETLDWDSPSEFLDKDCRVDMIVMGDVTYNPSTFTCLISVVANLARRNPHILLLMAHKLRHVAESEFTIFLKKAGFILTEELNTCLTWCGEIEKLGITTYCFHNPKIQVE